MILKSQLKLTGISLRAEHYQAFLNEYPGVAWIEVHTEDYFNEGSPAFTALQRIRSHYPVSLHGTDLSIGSTDDLNWDYLKKLRELCQQIDPCLVSDHLSWSSVNGHYLHQTLPLPYTEETLNHVVARIQQVQDFLQRKLLIENIAQIIQFDQSTFTEAEFITEVAKRSGCSILLNLTHLYVSACNLGLNPEAYLQHIPVKLVEEIHLSGFSTTQIQEKEVFLDSCNRAIVPAIWDLFRDAVKQFGTKATLVEWQTELPTLSTLCLEAYRAEQIVRESYVATKLTA